VTCQIWRRCHAQTLLLDTERAPIRLGRARQLAQALQADYHHIDDLAPGVPGRTWRTS
jgi:magnesium chelatase subunit ChlD-like protein